MNRTIDSLLKASFVRDLFERNKDALHLSKFRISDCETNPIRLSKKGGKAVIEFILRLGSLRNKGTIEKTLIGKWRPDERGAHTFQLLVELQRKGFNGRDHLRISEPILYLPECNLLLTSKARGVELKSMLAGDTDQLTSSVNRTARWFLKLHHTRSKVARRFSMRREEAELNDWLQHLSLVSPSCTGRVRKVVGVVLEMERSLDPGAFTLIHGDLHPKNIFVDGEDLTVIDFEQSCVFDPAKDLGYFIAQTNIHCAARRRRGLSYANASTLQECLLDEYTRGASREGLARVAVYEARSYLQHLHYDYWTLNRKIDPMDFKHWIGEAEECIAITA